MLVILGFAIIKVRMVTYSLAFVCKSLSLLAQCSEPHISQCNRWWIFLERLYPTYYTPFYAMLYIPTAWISSPSTTCVICLVRSGKPSCKIRYDFINPQPAKFGCYRQQTVGINVLYCTQIEPFLSWALLMWKYDRSVQGYTWYWLSSAFQSELPQKAEG